MNDNMDSGVPGPKRLFTGIWIVEIYIAVLPVRYYGYYSNKCRGMRKKADKDSAIPAVNHPELSPKKFRKNWARLIQKIYEVAPLVCPKCQGEMRIIAFIEIPHIIKKILKHLGLRDTQ